MKFDLNPYKIELICENETTDVVFETILKENQLELYVSATVDKPKFVKLFWQVKSNENELVLGDAWERSYGDLGFKQLSQNDRYMPWYFIATNKKTSTCFGVKTGANSFVSFKYDNNELFALVDCRNGGNGVELLGRRLLLATFVYTEYDHGDVINALRDYCGKLCDTPILPNERIYGGNNWYYAYGKSNYKRIIRDAKLQKELSKGIDNKPFQVIDDCWQKYSCAGPWQPNWKFRDMKKLADEIKSLGVRPGIWVRLLYNKDKSITKDMKILRGGKRVYLDPTHPKTQQYIKEDLERIKGWGYELIKHDFSTADLFGSYGKDLGATITPIDNWNFYDKTKTNAEIVLDFYRLIKETCGDMLIIGCNTVSHLSAGYVHIYRIGDDTSGREWERTKKMGVNTLAFRLCQNKIFYMCDADCVGILKNKIPWKKNSQWLELLSYSETPLFVSCTDNIDEEQKNDLATAYKVFNEPHSITPVDIFETLTPSQWIIDGKTRKFDW